MDLLPTEEQQQIIDTAASFLGNEFPVQELLGKAEGESRLTRKQLRQVAAMGWIGIGLPDASASATHVSTCAFRRSLPTPSSAARAAAT